MVLNRLNAATAISLLLLGLGVRAQTSDFFSTGLAAEDVNYIAKNKINGVLPVSTNRAVAKRLAVPLDQYIPGVMNQGKQGACTAFAVSAALSIRENYLNRRKRGGVGSNTQVLYSPAYLWVVSNRGRAADEDCRKVGISYSKAFSTLFTEQIVYWNTYPYPDDDFGLCHARCPDDVLVKKISDRKFSYDDVILDIEAFKKLLTQGYPICIATNLDVGFSNALYKKELKGKWVSKQMSTGEQHAMVIVDYDDDKQCFKVLDSHGPELADQGFIWLPYSLVNRNLDLGVVYGCYIVSFDKITTFGPSRIVAYSSPTAALGFKITDVDLKGTFSGKVVDEDGKPMLGVNVKALGKKSSSTLTDAMGKFSINPSENAQYEIQFLGYSPTTMTLKYKYHEEYSKNSVVDWTKPDNYRVFNELRVGVVSFNQQENTTLLSLVDDSTGQPTVNNVELQIGETIEVKIPSGILRMSFDKIATAGNKLNLVSRYATYIRYELISKENKLIQYW